MTNQRLDCSNLKDAPAKSEPRIYRGTAIVRRSWTLFWLLFAAAGIVGMWDAVFNSSTTNGVGVGLVVGLALCAMSGYFILETHTAHTALHPDFIATKAIMPSLNRRLSLQEIASKSVTGSWVKMYVIHSRDLSKPNVTFGTYPNEEDEYFREWMAKIPNAENKKRK